MKLIERLTKIETLLAEWLTDNTEEVFEEQPEIDDARGMIIDLISELEDKTPGGSL